MIFSLTNRTISLTISSSTVNIMNYVYLILYYTTNTKNKAYVLSDVSQLNPPTNNFL